MKLSSRVAPAALLLFSAACSGGKPSSRATPTFTPAPSSSVAPNAARPAHPVVDDHCLRGLSSYRFAGSFAVRPVPGAGVATAPAAGEGGAFAGSLANLLSSVSFQGAALAPDRYQATINFGGSGVQSLQVVKVAGQTFSRFSDGPWQQLDQTQAFGGIERFDPQSLCTGFLASVDAGVQQPTQETVNGVPSLRYELSGRQFARIGTATSRAATPDAGAPQGQLTVWRAEKGGYPVRFELIGSTEGGTFDLLMNVSDINSKDIQISAPG